MLSALVRDARYGLRSLAKTPGITSIAILALALGIGANTAIFTLIKATLLSPIPYPDPDRVTLITRSNRGNVIPTLSVLKIDYWRRNTRSFEAVAGTDVFGGGYNLVAPGAEPERLIGVRVMGDFFRAVGVMPAIGRGFSPAEDRAGGPRSVVLSYGLWQRRFGGDPNMIGRHLTLSGEDYEVIGVMPRQFRPAPEAEIWLPLQAPIKGDDISNYLFCIARLRPGVALAQARSEIEGVFKNFSREFPKSVFNGEGIMVMPAGELLGSLIRPALLMLMGAVAFVLLIACANVANLLMTRATARTKEIAIRVSMGATRWDLGRQLLVESVMLALGGAILGYLLGWLGVRVLVSVMPITIPMFDFSPDARVLAFAIGAALVTGCLFGLAPAIQAWHTDVNNTLKEAGRAGETRRRGLVRRALVGVEVALAVVLVIGAALLVQTVLRLRGVNPGFDPNNVITMQMSMTGPRYADPVQMDNFYRRGIERIENLPGVESAATVTSLPTELGPDFAYKVLGQDSAEGGAQWRAVTPGYFRTLKIQILRGRPFTLSDSAQSTPAVIVNESFVRRHWPGKDGIGERIEIGSEQNVGDPPRVVVGVAADVKESGLGNATPLIMYLPTAQVPATANRMINSILPTHWVVRTRSDPMSLVPAIRNELRTVDFQQPVSNVRTMEQVIGKSLVLQNLSAGLLGVFAGLALLLAAIGVYGVMSYSVAQRTHEIGIRMALGAAPRGITRMVLRQAGAITIAGIVVGLLGAALLTRTMSSLLYGVSATHPGTFGTVAFLLLAVALLASYVPASRATRVDPVISLRQE